MGYNRWLKDFFAAWKNLRRIAPAWSRLIGDRGYTDTLDLALALENLGILAKCSTPDGKSSASIRGGAEDLQSLCKAKSRTVLIRCQAGGETARGITEVGCRAMRPSRR